MHRKNPETIVRHKGKLTFGENIVLGPNTKELTLGFGCFLADNLYIDVPYLHIGDYVSIMTGSTIHGYEPCRIGHNCWIGQFSIIDSIGGTTIGNNVGIGAHSQLWSHIKFGDTSAGCRWNSKSRLLVEDDVWFVGHCIVSPIHAHQKSMALVGSVVTRDMEENHVYGGSPAKDLTDKVGHQFDPQWTVQDRRRTFLVHFDSYQKQGGDISKIKLVEDIASRQDDQYTYIDIKQRQYAPRRTPEEHAFIKYMNYDKCKLLPYGTDNETLLALK